MTGLDIGEEGVGAEEEGREDVVEAAEGLSASSKLCEKMQQIVRMREDEVRVKGGWFRDNCSRWMV